jgi:acyl-CoA thioesterase FadM
LNLYLRLLLTVLKALRAPRITPGQTVELRLCVLPNDLDLNGHMNNGRYLTIVDLGLVTMFVSSGFARLCLKNKWRPMGGGSIVYFRRGLTLFQRYTLRFTLVGWDEYWNYCRFEFVRGKEICATGYVKGAVSRRSGLVPNAEIYPALGHAAPSPPLPEELQSWIESDRVLGDRVREGVKN